MRAGHTTDGNVWNGCPDMIANPADYIISINDFPFLCVLLTVGNTHESVHCVRLNLSQLIRHFFQTAALCCSAWMTWIIVNLFLVGMYCQFLWMLCYRLTSFLCKDAVWPFSTWHLKVIFLSAASLLQKLLGYNISHVLIGVCFFPSISNHYRYMQNP